MPRFAAAGVDEEIAAAIDLFYNLEFDRALAAMDSLESRHPGHPAAPFYRSIIHYQRYTTEIPRSTETLKSFEEENHSAAARAEAWLSSDPATAEFYLGASHGYAARVLTAQKHYLKAIPKARKAARHLKRAVQLDPERYDGYLGLGMYNYFTARVPRAAKPFVFLLGIRGNRELGLKQLELAAEKGEAAKMEARSVLASIYATDREAQWEKADVILAEQMVRYPGNPSDRFRRIYAAQRMGRWMDAVSYADPDGEWILRAPAYLQEHVRALAFYRAAESLLFAGQAERAGVYLGELERGQLSGSIKDWTALRRANQQDLLGERSAALRLYHFLARQKADTGAKAYFKKPFPLGPPHLMPFDEGLGLD